MPPHSVPHSVRERQDLADAMLAAGPDAPTLCEGWTVRDLAEHLLARERRPDAALGATLPFLAGWSERVRRGYRASPFEDVVDRFRSGPPSLGWSALPGVDARLNVGEFLVHHEDVRRAGPGWQPRNLDPALEEVAWTAAVGASRLLLRRLRAGVELEWPAGAGREGRRRRVRKGEPVVTVSGPPLELLLYVFGRRSVARVQLTGDASAVQALRDLDLHA